VNCCTTYFVPFTPMAPLPVKPVRPVDVIEKLRVTSVAALYQVSPVCEAVNVQVPEATKVTLNPVTVHTLVVDDATVTAKPESDDGETVIGVEDHVWEDIAANVIVCGALLIVKLTDTSVAAA
jgi:hypothetical protein